MGCASSKEPLLDSRKSDQHPEQQSEQQWKTSEFCSARWTPIEKLFQQPADHETRTKLKAWCKTNSAAKQAKLVDVVDAYDDVIKRRAVFQSAQRCGDSLETGQGILEANGKAIVEKYLVETGSKYVGSLVGGEWGDPEFVAQLKLTETDVFNTLQTALIRYFQSAVEKMP
ncbi:hypothetical protein HDU77_003190 [Chytriomyces hyalinus]|nr:hypothetical protein HDU77_003190 [Chytriomyces hyalinus]